MPRPHPRTRPSRMALMMSLFFLNALATETTSSTPPRSLARRDSWRPDTELPGAKFVLGDGKTEGVKAKGYEGEWPLWSGFRNGQASDRPVASSSGTQPAVAAGNATDYVCVPAGDCNPCPDDVVHLPFCRPYNNRRRVACSPVADRADASAVRTAMDTANAARNATGSTAAALLGWEACGKSAKQEAKDYFEMIAVVAVLAVVSVWAFVQRQKLLFQRQNQQLLYRVSGQRRSSGMPNATAATPRAPAPGRKRAARLAPPLASSSRS
ncbi:hypothetical protein PANT_10d00032 [Moesziomyces antarcticus T-34]|uniref:Uncharacterized protein n=1 Tax=Pseudozyma antarctica (strain T-34) TaxID=1151754 RepID=M9M228_PSEA3|nr:hypothetical protein PANT_10d00032 [Moesziomyces antarcticus T-34]